ncbi:hypothetical protein ACHAW5_006365 [Stephanodiscus triporus]|uniref:Uncharacterized protein n=1 Tax=Stephanodiscus triporus TaxID=2934178 RepID=A0ABD3MNW3_9STRA
MLKADVAARGIGTISSAEEEERWRAMPVGGHERRLDAGMLDAASGIGHPTIGGANGGGIYVGEGTNVQDGCIVTSYEGHTTIGRYVTVGHAAHIHSATVGDESLIGMGAVLKPGCVVEGQSFVAAGAVVERGQVVREGELWGGNPARKLRDLSAEERARLRTQAEKYINVAQSHSHVMELGGNVPDSFIRYDLLGTGASVDATLSVESNKPIELPSSSDKDKNLTVKEGLKGQKMDEGIDHKPIQDLYDREEDATDELRVRVKL